jgi:hypothetical protein
LQICAKSGPALPGEAVWAFKPGDKVLIKVDPGKAEESLFLGAA